MTSNIKEDLARKLHLHLKEIGMTETAFANDVMHNPSFWARLRDKNRTISSTTIDRINDFIQGERGS